MKGAKYSALVAVLALLTTGFQTQTQFESTAKELKQDPAFRRQVFTECQGKFEAYPNSVKRDLAAYIGVLVHEFPYEWCRRLIALMASGRMSYRDYVDIRNGPYNDDDKLFRMIRSRGSPPPSAGHAPNGERRPSLGHGDAGNSVRGSGAQR